MARSAAKAAKMGVVATASAAQPVDVSATTTASTPNGGGGKENPRKRPKSKNGCQRCKLKRLKCDETKPSCRNCVARHIDCPGYGKLLKWCDKYQSYLSGERPGRSQVQSQTLATRRRDSGRKPPPTTTTKRKEDIDGRRERSGSAGDGEENSAEDANGDPKGNEDRPQTLAAGMKRRREGEETGVEEEGSAPARWNQAVGMHLRRVVECVAPVEETRGPSRRTEESGGRGDEETIPQEVDRGPESQGGDAEVDAAPINMASPGLLDIDLDSELADIDLPAMGFEAPEAGTQGVDESGDIEELPPTRPEDALHFNDLPEDTIQSFYMRANSAPGPSLVDPAMKLVAYYFSNVCPLYSAFDSALNPFRSAVGQIWDSSPSVYYSIQSMAAAQLANFYPEMIFTGLEMQRKAYRCLQDEMQLVTAGCQSSDRALLTLLLLGPSASWHDSSDLGLSHLSAARALIYPRLIAPVPPGNNLLRRRNQFFEEALIYWEMLIGFVEPESNSSNIGPLGLASSFLNGNSDSPARKLLPHPWTGIAPKVQTIFAEVGRLIRQERLSKSRHNANRSFFGSSSLPASSFRTGRAKDAADNLAWATVLEGHLLSASLPTTDDLIDPGDVNTTRADFVAIGEAYRCAGLLELYRVFPSLLRKRLGAANQTAAAAAAAASSANNPNNTVPAAPDRLVGDDEHDNFEYNLATSAWQSSLGISGHPTPHAAVSSSNTPHPTASSTDARSFLNSLALHILSMLESLPDSSGTMSTQPILLVAAASELRYVTSLDYWDFDAGAEAVRHARSFVVDRMTAFARRLPRRPLECMTELIEEVWRRGGDTFWVDVMLEKGWQTVMG